MIEASLGTAPADLAAQLLPSLGVQTLVLSGALLLLWLLRPVLLRLLGAGATYAAWWALPLLLLGMAWPRSEAFV
ncbi:MAG: hypothetical protein O9341_00925, partial [Paucibacter sp.]|nr:hypothetical protein [Roseateles sp.]